MKENKGMTNKERILSRGKRIHSAAENQLAILFKLTLRFSRQKKRIIR